MDRVSIAWLWLCVRFAIAVLALLVPLTGCALTYPPGPGTFTPEPPAPSANRIAELMALSADTPSLSESNFSVRVYPAFVFAGQAARITCFVPASYGRGRLRIALEGIRTSDHPLDRIETQLLIERVPCGQHVASCTVRSGRGLERREQKLESRGGVCDQAVTFDARAVGRQVHQR